MKFINLRYDRVSRALTTTDTDAGSVVDNATTTLHVDPIDGCVMDLVYGVVMREGTTLKGHPFSRLDSDGDAILYSDVLRACTGGALPVSLRLTWDDNRIEQSRTCILKVRHSPDADIMTEVRYSDLAMTRNSSMLWVPRWRYATGAVVVHNGAMWLALTSSTGSEPMAGSDVWVEVGGTESEDIGVLMGIRGNVQEQLDALQERIEESRDAGLRTVQVTVPRGNWVATDGGWVQTIQHIGIRADSQTRVTWERDQYLECWKADVYITAVTDGSATVMAATRPATNVTLTLTQWSETE